MTVLYCPRCKARGPIQGVRHIAQTRDLTDEEGEAASGEWEYAGSVHRSGFLRCGLCGHAWATRRDLPEMREA